MDDALAVSRMRNVVKSMMWRRARTEALTLPFHVHPRHIIGAVCSYNEAKNAIRSGGFRPAAADGPPDRLLSMIAHAASALAFISRSTSA